MRRLKSSQRFRHHFKRYGLSRKIESTCRYCTYHIATLNLGRGFGDFADWERARFSEDMAYEEVRACEHYS